ncbi:MAG: protein kinase [Planctomycetaceae bacterium]|nr:protein kinase [Planctomycetaceae bacterium]
MDHSVGNLLHRFTQNWSDESGFLQSYLQQADDATARELIQLDVQKRIERGECPSEQTYADLFERPPNWLPKLIADCASKGPKTIRAAGATWHPVTDEPFVQDKVQQADVDSANVAASEQGTTRGLPGGQHGPVASGGNDDWPGRIDKYVVERPLGRGAFGVVLLARDSGLDRQVAIKLPHRHLLEQPGVLERFLDEAKAVAKLSHHGIVPIFDHGKLADGRAFAVLEYLPGGTLSHQLRKSRCDLLDAVDLMIQLAEAAHYAHLRGVFHLDLKPSNVLLDERGRAKISDFGLALRAEDQLNLDEFVAGTPSYMSPEQTRGETPVVDGRSDIWSLGVIFYHMLVGQLPFRGRTVSDLFDSIRKHDPRPLRQINDQIPAEIERIVKCCLEKNPKDRYQTAADLAQDLQSWRQGYSGSVPGQAVPGSRQSAATRRPDSGSFDAAAVGSTTRGGGSSTMPPAADDSESVTTVQPSNQTVAASPWNRISPSLLAALALPFLAVLLGPYLWPTVTPSAAPQPLLPDTNSSSATPPGQSPVQGADDPPDAATVPASTPTVEALTLVADPEQDLETVVPAGQWVPLFARQPTVVHWPLLVQDSEWKFDEAKRELWLTVKGMGVIELWQSQAKNTQVRATFFQPQWVGGWGFYWGYKPLDNGPGATYQRIITVMVPEKLKPTLHLSYDVVECDQFGMDINTIRVQECTLPDVASVVRGATLQLQFEDQELKQVSWCGQECPDLVKVNPYTTVTKEQSIGGFGVIGWHSHTIVRQAMFKHTVE